MASHTDSGTETPVPVAAVDIFRQKSCECTALGQFL